MANNVTISVAIDREMEEKLIALSIRADRSISKLVRDAITQMLEADKRG